VLELVVGQRLGLAEVALGKQLEKRLARHVVGEAVLNDHPADRCAICECCQLVARRWCIGAEAPKGSSLLPSVWISQREPVARWLRLHTRLHDPLHEPVPASDQHDRARRERVLARIGVDALATSAVVRDDFVGDGQRSALSSEGRDAGASATQPSGASSRALPACAARSE
jgi:hypothetical protein